MTRRIFRLVKRAAFTTVLLTSLLPLDVLAKSDFPKTDREILELFNDKDIQELMSLQRILQELQELYDKMFRDRLKKALLKQGLLKLPN